MPQSTTSETKDDRMTMIMSDLQFLSQPLPSNPVGVLRAVSLGIASSVFEDVACVNGSKAAGVAAKGRVSGVNVGPFLDEVELLVGLEILENVVGLASAGYHIELVNGPGNRVGDTSELDLVVRVYDVPCFPLYPSESVDLCEERPE